MRPRHIIAAGLAAAVRLARNTQRAVRYGSQGTRQCCVSRDASPLPAIDSTRRLAPLALIAQPIPPDDDPTPSAPVIIKIPGRAAPQIVRDSTPLPSLTAEQHADTFLDWLQDDAPVAEWATEGAQMRGRTGDDILVCDLEEMHREMCLDLGVALMRWAMVSKHFRALVGERKRYVWHRETPDADKVRLCVMSVPARVPWAELPHAQAA